MKRVATMLDRWDDFPYIFVSPMEGFSFKFTRWAPSKMATGEPCPVPRGHKYGDMLFLDVDLFGGNDERIMILDISKLPEDVKETIQAVFSFIRDEAFSLHCLKKRGLSFQRYTDAVEPSLCGAGAIIGVIEAWLAWDEGGRDPETETRLCEILCSRRECFELVKLWDSPDALLARTLVESSVPSDGKLKVEDVNGRSEAEEEGGRERNGNGASTPPCEGRGGGVPRVLGNRLQEGGGKAFSLATSEGIVWGRSFFFPSPGRAVEQPCSAGAQSPSFPPVESPDMNGHSEAEKKGGRERNRNEAPFPGGRGESKEEAGASEKGEELERVENVLLDVVKEIRKRKQVLSAVKAKTKAHAEKKIVSSPSSPMAAAAAAAAVSLPQEVNAARRLLVEVERVAAEAKKKIAVAFDQMIGCNFTMNLHPVVKPGVGAGSVLRSFQAVNPETLRTALDAFIERGEKDDLLLCLAVGVEIDGLVKRQTALMRAVTSGNLQAVIRLVRWGAGLEVRGAGGFTALHEACFAREVIIGRILLAWGANANAETYYGIRPLHLAVEHGAVDLFAPLFSHKAELHAKNANGNRALHLAALSGQRGAIEKLLDLGARVNERGDGGGSPLHFAAPLNDHSDAAELLLSRGANVNARDDMGKTILHWFALFGCVRVAEIVLDAGADVQTTDNQGWTALHHAAWRSSNMDTFLVDQQKKLRIAQILVSRGINVNAVTDDGMTALALAERNLPADPPIRTFLAGLSPQLQEQ
uniref:Uncharacterized protein n=1 Tax=Chromera velia CCMP2878 TaxID=1169474 RepID=A0A0G4I6E5_9ALVE|eukprot:Cvel_11309.t1-p1 / transcript=Cvel_11309.t1 / gene=Cvel_11309 / organism=Chromera_velia_CCMP2878 / gene_product=Ankyrin-3, putative / transcript_product=Ankyrin-3, putative / location=Cvel_scaffold707:12568-18372(+) / protein_length=753 / sequence_SO=supercontig / SO=protein_coding / is_pseudo=false